MKTTLAAAAAILSRYQCRRLCRRLSRQGSLHFSGSDLELDGLLYWCPRWRELGNDRVRRSIRSLLWEFRDLSACDLPLRVSSRRS